MWFIWCYDIFEMKKVLNVLLSLMLLCVNILTPFVDVVKSEEITPVSIEELGEEEINKGLDEIFAKVNPTSIKDMGKLMAEANELFGVKADKSLVSKLIKDRLI